ncbi:MAG: hypothetical protein ACLT0Y_01420 [Christensenellales bacterium]
MARRVITLATPVGYLGGLALMILPLAARAACLPATLCLPYCPAGRCLVRFSCVRTM